MNDLLLLKPNTLGKYDEIYWTPEMLKLPDFLWLRQYVGDNAIMRKTLIDFNLDVM